MKEYNTNIIQGIYEDIKDKKILTLKRDTSVNLFEIVYFLIKQRIRTFIIDDYLLSISNKSSLLEALYYQIGLFDMHDLNWDAFQEALENYINNNDCGVVLIFRNGIELKDQLANEFKTLEEIIDDLNINRSVENGIILV